MPKTTKKEVVEKKSKPAKTWLSHVKSTWAKMKKSNAKASYKSAMTAAAKTWKKKWVVFFISIWIHIISSLTLLMSNMNLDGIQTMEEFIDQAGLPDTTDKTSLKRRWKKMKADFPNVIIWGFKNHWFEFFGGLEPMILNTANAIQEQEDRIYQLEKEKKVKSILTNP